MDICGEESSFGVYSLWTVGNLCLGVGENLSIFFGLGFDFSDIRLQFDGIGKCVKSSKDKRKLSINLIRCILESDYIAIYK